jgi:hypothetical protein
MNVLAFLSSCWFGLCKVGETDARMGLLYLNSQVFISFDMCSEPVHGKQKKLH